ncbi:MAG: methylated-DNA--[protein]-cysteine S-methyltransferase [Solirubrobacterales bacterium]
MDVAVTISTFDSPVGRLALVADGDALAGVRFPGRSGGPRTGAAAESGVLADAARQLSEYFAQERTSFDLPLTLDGSRFQLRVWAALRRIPFGETVSYGELAKRIAVPGEDAPDPRDVGAAVGRTPTPIVVPCHRVIGADGSLVGYGGGLERKRALLDLEASQLALI